MSKSISILEGGQARNFGHVQKLKTQKSGGGEVLWVPKDEVETQSLYVSENGTYYCDGTIVYTKTKTVKKKGKKKKVTTTVTAHDADNICYGFDEVDVNIINSVSGSRDGRDYSIGVGDDGFLEEEELPTYIKITTQPTQLNYVDGQTINFEGGVVTAYYGDDSEWGEVPVEELSFVPNTASIGYKEADKTEETQDLQTYTLPVPFYFQEGGRIVVTIIDRKTGNIREQHIYEADEGQMLTNFGFVQSETNGTTWRNYWIKASASQFSGCETDVYHGKTVYWDGVRAGGWSGGGDVTIVPIFNEFHGDTPNQTGQIRTMFSSIAWLMIHGEVSGGGEVSVQWARPEDEEILEDTYEIIVGQGPIPPNENQSGSSSGGAGDGGGSW